MREPHEATVVNRASWPVMFMMVGVGLMVLAPLVVGVLPDGAVAFWTDEDQAALQKASADFHAVNSALADGSGERFVSGQREAFDPIAARARHAAAKAELEKQQSRLNAAQTRPSWIMWLLRLMGVGLSVVGVWAYLRTASPRGRGG
jgi:hypothetical protein